MMKLANLAHFALVGLLTVTAAQAPTPRDDNEIELNGVIHPSQLIEISGGTLTGILQEINVDRGDEVEEGQLLAVLDARLDEANLRLARARVELVAALEASLAARDFFADVYARAQSLFEEGVVSTELRDRAEEDALLAESRWRVEQESHTLWRLELERSLVALELRRIVSPVSGVVIDRMIDVGEFVGDGALLRIAKLDPLYVEVVAPAALYGSIRIGATATVMPGDPVGGSYAARIAVVDKVLDAASNTFGIRLELPNPGNRLPAGIRTRVRLPLEPARRP